MQITIRQHIDFFKVFKILELKKIDKHGEVKIVQDKVLGRKVLSVEGSVSTQNYIIFDCSEAAKAHPSLSFSQKYLYVVGWAEFSKVFCFQIVLRINSKVFKALYSTIHKTEKLNPQGVLQLPLELKSCKWSIVVIDLHELCTKYLKSNEARLNFELASLEIRAHSRIKNIYLSDNLYEPSRLPKDMQLPLLSGEDFYMKYTYSISGAHGGILDQNPKIQSTGDKLRQPLKNHGRNFPSEVGEKTEISEARISKSMRTIKKTHTTKRDKNTQENESQNLGLVDTEDVPIINKAPKPLSTIDLKLYALEGYTLFCNGVTSLGAFITSPSVFAVHQYINCMSIHLSNSLRLVVGYQNGCICIWDMGRQQSLLYLKTELGELKQVMAKGEGEEEKIYVVGLDKMKRETILIANSQQVLFRQISNYSINQFLVSSGQGHQVLISYGFENIRLWKMNESNRIITGTGLYLGKLNRLVTYSHACAIHDDLVLVVDNSGYLTVLSLSSEKVERVQKISENGLDRILNVPELNGVVIAESSGTLKLLSYGLEVLEQYDLSNRVRTMFYRVEEGSIKLYINHYNCSSAVFCVTDGSYRYESRQHAGQVISLAYNRQLNRLVSIGKDNSIRIWGLWGSQIKKNKLQYSLKQEYEFLINSGEAMTSLAADENVYAYVGFKGGLVRKINLEKYIVEIEKSFAFREQDEPMKQLNIQQIKVSKNNRHILVSVSHPGTHGYAVLCDQFMDIRYKYNPPVSQCWQFLAGFSETHKKTYFCWSYGVTNRFQIFSLTEDIGQVCSEFYIESTPINIQYVNETVRIDAVGMYEIYKESGELTKVLNTSSNQRHAIWGPLMVFDNGKLQLQLQMLQSGLKKCIELPESVENITIFCCNKQLIDLKGLIFFSGQKSHALYVVEFTVRNAEMEIGNVKFGHGSEPQQKLKPIQNNQMDSVVEQEELECVENKLVIFDDSEDIADQQKFTTHHQHTQQRINKQSSIDPRLSQPTSLQKLYEGQENLYNQCKSIFQMNSAISKDVPCLLSPGEEQDKQQTSLIFGWNNYYSPSKDGSDRLFWDPSSQSTLFLSQRTLILHYFKEPVKQKIVRLPIQPSLIVPLGRSHICVAMGNQLRVFTKTLHHIKSLSVMGESISSICLSNCEGYLIVLSSSQATNKDYIQIIDIVTSSTLCSTYLSRAEGLCKIECNPYQQRLQFLIHTEKGVIFYRLSSILTLQTQQLEGMTSILSNSDMGGICCARYLKLAEDQIILLGMQDGSIILVDSRSNSIMMVFKNVCKASILDILYSQSKTNMNEKNSLTLALITNSSNILGYEIQHPNLNALVSILDKDPSIKLNTDSELTLHSNLEFVGQDRLAMLAMSKFGVLWLIDLTGHDTIKVLSVHCGVGALQKPSYSITKALVKETDGILISGSGDGTVKETLLNNLEQANEIYRPRRCVCDILLMDELLIVAFGLQLSFYTVQNVKSGQLALGWKFFGSIDLRQLHQLNKTSNFCNQADLKVISIKNIPFSDSFVVCTSSSLFMLYYQKILSQKTGKLKVEIKQLWRTTEKAQSMELIGFNHILVRESSKISVWGRKQKRGEPVLQQLSKIEELAYYMLDVYQVDAGSTKFVTSAHNKHSSQYICSLSQKPIIQWRDFEQHCIIRQIEVAASGITCLQPSRDGGFVVGDRQGTVWHIKENGLTLNKVKLFDSPVEGVVEMLNRRVMAYGPCVAIVNI